MRTTTTTNNNKNAMDEFDLFGPPVTQEQINPKAEGDNILAQLHECIVDPPTADDGTIASKKEWCERWKELCVSASLPCLTH